jgi:signal transduction histidine kinase
MEASAKTGKAPARSLPEAITRTLRHEVGDLLQTLYAGVAVLQKRLPADWSLERRVLTDMRNRAEACKQLLDTVHDCVCPLSLSWEDVDLAELVATTVQRAAVQYPQLQVEAKEINPTAVQADGRRLIQVAEILLANACQSARHRVSFRIEARPTPGEIEWTVAHDGPGMPDEQIEQLFTPFTTTRHGLAGLGMALAHRIISSHGGRMSAENVPDGGFRVQVILPVAPPAGVQESQS